MALDIGAKSTSLIFIEGGKFFVRSIPIGGNMITTEISKGLGISFAEAEQLKLEKGFVALGGTYAIQDDVEADKCSKIIRNVVTRLHMEINRSINFYRSQQGGSAPERIILTGGASMTKMLNEFFAEKFAIPVDYMNPFAGVAVEIDNGIDVANEELFLLSNSVGLMLRKCVSCPVEIDLMPSNVIAARKYVKNYVKLVECVKEHWKGKSILTTFSPDHGGHRVLKCLIGTHGHDIPEDRNIYHFFTAIAVKE
jgi:cell division ATPase FtsA